MFAVPANMDNITNYCSDPNILVDASGDNNNGVNGPDGEEDIFPAGTRCSDLPAIFKSFPTGPYDANSSTRTFLTN